MSAGTNPPQVTGEEAEAVTNPASDRIYQLKVVLKGSKPPIWRRMMVPDVTLDLLSDYIIAAMGWEDNHLHAFDIAGDRYSVSDADWDIEDMFDESSFTIGQAVIDPAHKFTWLYDFGDGWEHEIAIEKVSRAQPGTFYPMCLAGRRACPPEDVGGISAYYDFLEAIGDRDHPEHEECVEWIGGHFDPAAFELAEVNEELHDVAIIGLETWDLF